MVTVGCERAYCATKEAAALKESSTFQQAKEHTRSWCNEIGRVTWPCMQILFSCASAELSLKLSCIHMTQMSMHKHTNCMEPRSQQRNSANVLPIHYITVDNTVKTYSYLASVVQSL